MNQILTTLWSNKHTTAAAVIYGASKLLLPLVAVWFPDLKPKVDATSSVLESFALFYGLAAAGDANKTKPEGQ
jgi:hypothetical protein